MPKFALRYPFFIIMACLMVLFVGVVNITRMPVDLFPKIDIPVVVVATFLRWHAARADRGRYHRYL